MDQTLRFYHDFKALGLEVQQRPGNYALNQRAKAPIISGYLLFAIGKAAQHDSPVTLAELFCADAYYSFLASRFGVSRCDAFDNNRDGHLAEANAIKDLLSADSVHIHQTDIFEIESTFHASIVLNTGGLYHVDDPLGALEKSYAMASRYLIVQTVTSLANENISYFEAPAPGWQHGCRFSHSWIENEIRKRDYFIVDSARNILTGNNRPEDRGSSYFLIDVTRTAKS
jgi:hypothetical protein